MSARAALCALLVLATAACSAETEPSAAKPPLVVLIVVDTLRADHTTLYGYHRDTTPALVSLARDGTTFLRAYAPAPWTRPSVASLLTGRSPDQHGTLGHFDVLPAELPTWPEVAQRAGYRTVAINTNANVLPIWGFGRGFDQFIDLNAATANGGPMASAADVFERALAILDEHGTPLFLYLHVLDPHHPYEPSAEALRAVDPDGPAVPRPPAELTGSPETLEAMITHYDAEIRGVDTELGRFLEGLQARGLYAGAVVVFVGDHGEEFRDHGGLLHGNTLYEELLRVPLVLKLPGVPGGARIEALAAIHDALPTVADLLGWEDIGGGSGRSLLPLIRDGLPVRQRVIATNQRRRSERLSHAIVTADAKLIHTSGGATLLFDLAQDPHEMQPRSDAARSAALEHELENALAQAAAGWHLLACGGAQTTRLALRVAGAEGSVRGIRLEDGDQLVADSDGVVASLEVGPLARLEGLEEPGDLPIPDYAREGDELVFRGSAPRLFIDEPTPLDVRIGERWSHGSGEIALSRDAARRPASAPESCGSAARPTVRIWWVPAPAAVATAQPDPAVAERLRALGYLASPHEATPEP